MSQDHSFLHVLAVVPRSTAASPRVDTATYAYGATMLGSGGPSSTPQRRCTIGPWTVVAVSLLLESIGGLFYMFGVFSGTLKNESWVGGEGANGTLTQGQLSLVSTAANIGGNLGLPVGLFVDRFGASASFWLCVCLFVCLCVCVCRPGIALC